MLLVSPVPRALGGVAEPHALVAWPWFAEENDGPFGKGTQWLVWKFESDATLGNALDGQLGSFPACLQVSTGRAGCWVMSSKDS